MAETKINSRRRNLKILALFFGLVFDFLRQYARARLSGRTYDFFADAERNRKRAIRIRETSLEMGGVLVKVGQFLSSRVDLLPSEYIEELSLLQDEVPAQPFEVIRPVIERELGGRVEDVFAAFDMQPIAAASLGQVYRAVLPTGPTVAVKVQRRDIDRVVAVDLRSLRYIVHWLDRHTALGRRIDLLEVLGEFEETLFLELDYRREGHHAERISTMFAAEPRLAVPRVYWSHTTARVLTLQLMTGTKVTDFHALDREGINRAAVAETLMEMYLHQVLVDGFFHADPHPGNVLVRPGPVVVLLDFGMVGQISHQNRENIRRVFIGVIRRDYDEIIIGLKRLGFFTRLADTLAIRRALTWGIENFYDVSFGEIRSIQPGAVIDEVQDILFSETFRIPANFAFLGRALGTLSGLCTSLDPSFQFVTVAEPYARNLIRRGRGVRGTADLVVKEAKSVARSAYRLPFLTVDLLEDAQAGELNLRHQFAEVVHAVEHVERSVRRLIYGIIAIGFLIVSVLIYGAHIEFAAIIALVLALGFLARLMFSSSRRRYP
jgi:predicted unusual protein kinase regulating ubiquinone biosynthesis (AarF/ABC1/UbiB family)